MPTPSTPPVEQPAPPAAAQAPVANAPAQEAQSPSAIPQDLAAGRVVTPVGEESKPPSLDMDWDDEELATQVYDKPSDLLAMGFSPSGLPPQASAPAPSAPPEAMGQNMGAAGMDPSPSTPPILQSGPPPSAPPPTMASNGPVPELGMPPSHDQMRPSAPSAPSPSGLPAPPYPEPELPSVPPPREERKGNGLIIGLSVLIVLLLLAGVALFIFMGRPQPGSIGGRVRPPTAQVFIDNRPVAVNTEGRFDVGDLRPGSYQMRAEADGFTPQSERVVVEAGTASPIALMLEPTVVEPPPAPVKTGLAVLVEPAGSSIYVNDVKRDEVTPAEFIETPAGSYAVKVIKEGYLPLNHQATVADGQVAQVTSKLRPEWITFEFKLLQDRARAYLRQEGLPEPERIKSGSGKAQPHRNPVLLFKGRGRRAKEVPLTIPDDATLGVALGEINLDDAEDKVRPPTPPRPRPRPGPSKPGPSKPPGPTKPPTPIRPPTPPRPPTPIKRGSDGYLSIQTVPWTKVYIDGRYVRTTPLMRHKLKSGRHRVNLVNEDFGIQKTITVNIDPDGHVKRTVRFNQ